VLDDVLVDVLDDEVDVVVIGSRRQYVSFNF